ncbi:MAG TPA: alpha/beta hydrolase [Caulobacteraceae bacterium]|nr:alpha/beta hydrolase [Caulobacteraceae bacterium]
MTRRALLASLAAGLTTACSPLSAFATLAPKDPARRAGAGLPYGGHPRQRMDFYQPRQAAGRAPVHVFFYGGNWNSGRRQDYGWVGQALAAQGFLAVVPDYRLVPEVRYPGFVEDGAAAVAEARRLASDLGGDPERVVVSGHSAGAYIAAMVALDPRWLQAAGAPPVRAFAGLSGPYDFYPFDVPASREAFAGAPDPGRSQPVNLPLRNPPPTFLAHGSRDQLVGVHNSRNLARRLEAAGGEVDFKLYEGLDHKDTVLALSRPFRGKASLLGDMTRFLKAHLD